MDGGWRAFAGFNPAATKSSKPIQLLLNAFRILINEKTYFAKTGTHARS